MKSEKVVSFPKRGEEKVKWTICVEPGMKEFVNAFRLDGCDLWSCFVNAPNFESLPELMKKARCELAVAVSNNRVVSL